MTEEAVAKSPDVVLGFDAAWGFARADQTSPALASQAGALIDTTLTGERVTELRIHGVSGSDGPTMLEHRRRCRSPVTRWQGFTGDGVRMARESPACRGNWRPTHGAG